MAFTRTCREESCVDRSSSSSSTSTATSSSLVAAVSAELDALRRLPPHRADVQFPPACRSLVLSLPGNARCADCDGPRPEWTSVSYGIMLCVQCGGRHRSYGVQSSRVKSLDMDSWSRDQILSMVEGGNDQLCRFFDRHQMMDETMTDRRYKTKAALFYRTHLRKHVDEVAKAKAYPGREAVRKAIVRRSSSSSKEPPASSPTLTRQSTPNTIQSPIQQSIACAAN